VKNEMGNIISETGARKPKLIVANEMNLSNHNIQDTISISDNISADETSYILGFPQKNPIKKFDSLSFIFLWFFNGSSIFFPGMFLLVKNNERFSKLKSLPDKLSSTKFTNNARPAIQLFQNIDVLTCDDDFLNTVEIEKIEALKKCTESPENRVQVYVRSFPSPRTLLQIPKIVTNIERYLKLKWNLNVFVTKQKKK
jgi:hypothetical protein